MTEVQKQKQCKLSLDHVAVQVRDWSNSCTKSARQRQRKESSLNKSTKRNITPRDNLSARLVLVLVLRRCNVHMGLVQEGDIGLQGQPQTQTLLLEGLLIRGAPGFAGGSGKGHGNDRQQEGDPQQRS